MRIVFLVVLVMSANLYGQAQSPLFSRAFHEGTKEAKAGNFGAALNNYRSAAKVSDETITAEMRSRLRFNIGVCLYRLDRADEAVSELKAAISLRGQYKDAEYVLGMAETKLGRWQDAEGNFLRALKLDPKDGEAWFDLGFVYLAKNDYSDSLLAFRNSVRFGSTDSAYAHNNIGVLLALQRDLDSAENEFNAALELSGGQNVEARHNLEFCSYVRRAGIQNLVATQFRIAGRSNASKT
jgi:tetratricopeptide (TPR) repeat protein